MSSAPIIPAEALAGIDDNELRRRASQLDLAVDLDDPEVRPLLWSLAFARWPDLLPVRDLDEPTLFYNQYFWFVRFIRRWQAAHGSNGSLEQEASKLLENAPADVDWEIVDRLYYQARDIE